MNPIWKVSWFLIVKLWDKYSQVCRCCVSWYSKGCSNSRWTPWTSEWGRDVLTFCLVFTFIERYLGFIEPAAVLLSSVPPVRGEITLFCVESNRQHMIWIVNLINMNYVTIRQLNQSCRWIVGIKIPTAGFWFIDSRNRSAIRMKGTYFPFSEGILKKEPPRHFVVTIRRDRSSLDSSQDVSHSF